MVVECILIPKELIFGVIIVWGVLSIIFLSIIYLRYKHKYDITLSNFEFLVGCISLVGILIMFTMILDYIIMGIIELSKLLPCIQVV